MPVQPAESSAASQAPAEMPLQETAAAAPNPPEAGAEVAAQEGGRGMLVWVVIAFFAALVVSSGFPITAS